MDWLRERLMRLVAGKRRVWWDEMDTVFQSLDGDGQRPIGTAAAEFLVGRTAKRGLSWLRFTLEGMSVSGAPAGNWQITVERLPENGTRAEIVNQPEKLSTTE